jgi:hypothetical protein
VFPASNSSQKLSKASQAPKRSRVWHLR